MIAATRRWVNRNRTNIAIGVGVLGTGYVAAQYALSRIGEARQRMSVDRISRENLRRRFQQNQEDCTFTVQALLPTAMENVLEDMPVEELTAELQRLKGEKLAQSSGDSAPSEQSSGPPSVADEDGKSLHSFQSEGYVHTSQITEGKQESPEGSRQSPAPKPKRTKMQLWNELKISSLTRAFTLLYTLSLLTLLTRIQLNLLGRRNYLSSVMAMAAAPKDGVSSPISLENHDNDNAEAAYGRDFETNRRYLTFSWWLLHRGWRDVKALVEAAVKEVFGPISLREDVTLERIAALIIEVRKKVEGATDEDRKAKKWLPYLLPPADMESFVLASSGMSPAAPAPTLRRLLDETADLIDSPSFSLVHTLLLDASFTQLSATLMTQAYKLPSKSETRVEDLDAKAKLPTILATVTKQAHAIGSGVPNTYLQSMDEVGELEAFSAVIYSSNWEIEEEAEASPSEVETEEAPIDGEASLIDASESMFESAWGKAQEKRKAES